MRVLLYYVRGDRASVRRLGNHVGTESAAVAIIVAHDEFLQVRRYLFECVTREASGFQV